MISSATIVELISTYGVAILAVVATLEGPIVTVIAAYLASQGLLVLWQVIVCVILADVAGDVVHYAMGRGMLDWLPPRLRERLGITPARRRQLARAFDRNGVRVLVVAKLTHVAGFAALLGAGAARMRFLPFLLANLAAAIPKSLFFVAIGYLFGGAHETIGRWLSIGSAALLLLLGAGVAIYLRRKAGR